MESCGSTMSRIHVDTKHCAPVKTVERARRKRQEGYGDGENYEI